MTAAGCPDDVLEAIRTDVHTVVDRQRWCFFDGYQPKGANPDRVAGVHTQDQFGRDDETVVAEAVTRDDLGVGEWRSRRAYLEVAPLVSTLELRLVAAVVELGTYRQPAFVQIDERSTLELRERALSTATARLDIVAKAWHLADRERQREARRHLDSAHISPPSARSAADRALRILERALSRGPADGHATAQLCRICRIRPAAERTAGRCHTCGTWRQRNRGAERPTSLDRDELAAPLAAAARRRARGEGWGAS